MLLGAERQTREEDVLKELHVLKAIDQCVRRCVRGRRRRCGGVIRRCFHAMHSRLTCAAAAAARRCCVCASTS